MGEFEAGDPARYEGGYDIAAVYGALVPASDKNSYPPALHTSGNNYNSHSYGDEPRPYGGGVSSRESGNGQAKPDEHDSNLNGSARLVEQGGGGPVEAGSGRSESGSDRDSSGGNYDEGRRPGEPEFTYGDSSYGRPAQTWYGKPKYTYGDTVYGGAPAPWTRYGEGVLNNYGRPARPAYGGGYGEDRDWAGYGRPQPIGRPSYGGINEKSTQEGPAYGGGRTKWPVSEEGYRDGQGYAGQQEQLYEGKMKDDEVPVFITSDAASQAYSDVFSDPVYGRAQGFSQHYDDDRKRERPPPPFDDWF